MKKTLMTTGAALFALSTAASAATFDIVDGTPGDIPGGSLVNEVLVNTFGFTPDQQLAGFFGSHIDLVGENRDVLVEYLGFEAFFQNSFSFGGNGFSTEVGDVGNDNEEYAANLGTNLGSFTVNSVNTGTLNFSFDTNGDAGGVTNAGNPDNVPGSSNFFAAWANDDNTSLFLFFDDGGVEANDDDNHDDIVVRLTVLDTATPVPVPAAGFLLVGALGALGAMKRRSRKS